jgi:hypothetical protein
MGQPVTAGAQHRLPLPGSARTEQPVHDQEVVATKDQQVAEGGSLGRELDREALAGLEGGHHRTPLDLHGPAATGLAHHLDRRVEQLGA